MWKDFPPISIGAWRDAHQKCFGARTLSSLPASLRLWEGIPVDSCWIGKKYVPPVLSFSREILTFLYCLDFHQAVYSILFVYLPHCLSFYSYIWDMCILTIHMPICIVVPIFLSVCLPSYFSITQLLINQFIHPSVHPSTSRFQTSRGLLKFVRILATLHICCVILGQSHTWQHWPKSLGGIRASLAASSSFLGCWYCKPTIWRKENRTFYFFVLISKFLFSPFLYFLGSFRVSTYGGLSTSGSSTGSQRHA